VVLKKRPRSKANLAKKEKKKRRAAKVKSNEENLGVSPTKKVSPCISSLF
jgi:hypothetical protein